MLLLRVYYCLLYFVLFQIIIIWAYHADLAFAFVYRDVLVSSPMPDNAVVKRKAGSVIMSSSSYIYLFFFVILEFCSDFCVSRIKLVNLCWFEVLCVLTFIISFIHDSLFANYLILLMIKIYNLLIWYLNLFHFLIHFSFLLSSILFCFMCRGFYFWKQEIERFRHRCSWGSHISRWFSKPSKIKHGMLI